MEAAGPDTKNPIAESRKQPQDQATPEDTLKRKAGDTWPESWSKNSAWGDYHEDGRDWWWWGSGDWQSYNHRGAWSWREHGSNSHLCEEPEPEQVSAPTSPASTIRGLDRKPSLESVVAALNRLQTVDMSDSKDLGTLAEALSVVLETPKKGKELQSPTESTGASSHQARAKPQAPPQARRTGT